MSFPYQRGSTGPGVSGIQTDLGDVPVDASFGDSTDASVRKFQTRHALLVDGVVGPITSKRLMLIRITALIVSTPIPAGWMLRGIAAQESNYDYGAVGSEHPADKGPLQINVDAPPQGSVTAAQAFDPSFAMPYCARFIVTRYAQYRADNTEKTARHAAVCSWHAPAWGDQWGDLGMAPNPDAALYVTRCHDKGSV